MSKAYDAKDITVLEGLEPVRKRPGMFIGSVDSVGLHHLVWELLDNAVDEGINGHATRVEVILHEDSETITVSDDGRGIPIDIHPKFKKPALELILTTLHSGGKLDGNNYAHSGGLHGVGASVVTALSDSLRATADRNGTRYTQTFSQGVVTGGKMKKFRLLGENEGAGTKVRFHPDPEIYPDVQFDHEVLRERLKATAYLHGELEFKFVDEVHGHTYDFHFPDGLNAYAAAIILKKKMNAVSKPFHVKLDDPNLEVSLIWTESTSLDHIHSHANGIPTINGGTHDVVSEWGLSALCGNT